MGIQDEEDTTATGVLCLTERSCMPNTTPNHEAAGHSRGLEPHLYVSAAEEN